MKDFLESRGTSGIYGSKDATREAFSKGLIAGGEAWMEMIQSRNRTSHTYNEETARQITNAIVTSYHEEFSGFLATFSRLEDAES